MAALRDNRNSSRVRPSNDKLKKNKTECEKNE